MIDCISYKHKHKVPLQANFLDNDNFHWLLWVLSFYGHNVEAWSFSRNTEGGPGNFFWNTEIFQTLVFLFDVHMFWTLLRGAVSQTSGQHPHKIFLVYWIHGAHVYTNPWRHLVFTVVKGLSRDISTYLEQGADHPPPLLRSPRRQVEIIWPCKIP
jgi:hypothetical protein